MREPRKKAQLAVSDPMVREHLLELMVCFYHGTPTKYFSCDREWFDGHLFDLMLVQFSYP